MNRKVIIGIVIVVVAAVAIGILAFGGPLNLNLPGGVSITGNGYTHTLNGSPNYHYEGTVTNSGTTTIRNVRFTVMFYGENHSLMRVEEVASIGDIPAGTSKNFSIDVPCPTQTIYSTEVTPIYEV